MTDKKTNDTSEATEATIFRLQKLYIKDISFENPNAPACFAAQQGSQPKVEINLGLENRKLDDDNYEVTVKVTAKVTQGEEAKVLFIIEVEHCGAFTIKNIPAEHMNAVLAVDCPTMMFPYTRQIVSQMTVDGGFVPFLMEPVNFLALFQNAQKQQADNQQQQ